MSAYYDVAPGDRYLTHAPCGPTCDSALSSSSFSSAAAALGVSPSDQRVAQTASSEVPTTWLAVKPYSFIFKAPVKGRWLGRGLLDLFLREFAFVPFAAAPKSPDTGKHRSNERSANDDGQDEVVRDGSEDEDNTVSSSTEPSVTRSAVIPLLLQKQSALSSTSSAAPGDETTQLHTTSVSAEVSGAATLDRRFTLPAYVEELCDGTLWLHRREAECRAVGRCYRAALIRIAHARDDDPPQQQNNNSAAFEGEKMMLHDDDAWLAWCRTVLWLSQLPSESDVDAILPQLHAEASTAFAKSRVSGNDTHAGLLHTGHACAQSTSTAAPPSPSPPAPLLLLLRQRDIVQHLVWRREGRMFAQPPLQILRCDIAAALERWRRPSASSAHGPAHAESPALIVVSKPPGLPVHPSGCYRKNSVTSLLEDIFGGGDGGHYYVAEEHFADREANTDGNTSKDGLDKEVGTKVAHSHRQEQHKAFRPYASIRHKKEGFELIRVFVRTASTSAASPPMVGVSLEDWQILKALLVSHEDGEGGKASDSSRKRTRNDAAGCNSGWTAAPSFPSSSPPSCSPDENCADENSSDAEVPANSGGARAGVSLPPQYALKAFVVHRLDAATSGVLLFGLDSETARRTAVAIANKSENENEEDDGNSSRGVNADRQKQSQHVNISEADTKQKITRGKEDGDVCAGTAPPTLSSSSQKVYCARVHGKVDLEALARTEHHCTLRVRPTATPAPPPHTIADVDAVADAVAAAAEVELVVERPIGCLDHHHSLYWSPDASLTDAWMKERQDQARNAAAAVAEEVMARGLRSGGARGKTARTPEAIAAKHERMRRLTRGVGGADDLSTTQSSSSGDAHEKNAQVFASQQRLGQYRQTLRTASTVLRVLFYDARLDETVVQCTLGTGRTHQLRVHLASLGHPIVLDSKYIAMERFMRQIAEQNPGDVLQSGELVADVGEGIVEERNTRVSEAGTPFPRASNAPLSLFYSTTHMAADFIKQTNPPADLCSGAADAAQRDGKVADDAPPAWKAVMFAETRTARGCVCPDAICLHAWRYTLTYPDSAEVVCVEVPLPSWAHRQSVADANSTAIQ